MPGRPAPGCYYALLVVFAVGHNSRVSAFPGNTTERICTDGARITSFPATGAGADPPRDVPAADVIAMLALAGGAAVGYLVVAAVLRLVGRFGMRERVPRFLQVGVRLLGAVAGGALVSLWLFGGGTGGWGSGGGGL